MPSTGSLSVANIRLANTAFSKTFFPRAMRAYWPRLCGTTRSSSIYEPFAFLGAAPILKYFNGQVASRPIQSWSMKVPNPAWKNLDVIKRNTFEFDQTFSLPGRVGQHGIRVAQLTDYLLANVILKGSTAGSQNFTNFDDGVTYTMTFDGQPLYGSHTITTPGGTTTFNNILTSAIPNTVAAVDAQDLTVTANQLQLAVSLAVKYFATLTDDSGALLYPDLDPARQLIVIVLPALWAGAELAFRTQGTLGGSNGSSSGSTTNIGYKMVKDVISWSLLQNCPDMVSGSPGAMLSPPNPTSFWIAVDGDYIKPYYFQRFMPLRPGQSIPLGEDPMAQAEAIVKALGQSGIDVRLEDAEVYAATEVDSNLGALGANSQPSVAIREEFFISSRSRQMVYPGPWMASVQVDPTGTSN